MVSVPLPALLADAVVDGDIHLRVEQQGEHIRGGEWVALLTPSMAEGAAPQHRALRWRHHMQYQRVPNETHSRSKGWEGEEMV